MESGMKAIKFDRIVVPTDFSDLATGALGFAQEISRRSGGVLDVIYADPFLPPPHFTSSQVTDLAEHLRESKARAADALERYVSDNVAAGIETRTAVIEDLAIPAIVDWAAENDADLIVMGTHGRSGINRMMLGSVTERVLRESRVPLMTVRSTEPSTEPIRTILCPVNFTGAAQKALEHAAELARLLEAKLVLVHVAEQNDRDEVDRSFDSCMVGFAESDPEVERVVLEGAPDEAVLDYLRNNHVDLMVIAATHRRFSDTTVLGSTTVHLIRHSPVPVLTVTAHPES